MTISIKKLRRQARIKLIKSFPLTFLLFLISGLAEPFNILLMFLGVPVIMAFTIHRINNIPCAACGKAYGVTTDPLQGIVVPKRCICCHEQATE